MRHGQPGEGQGRVDRRRDLRARRPGPRSFFFIWRASDAILVPGGFGERGTEGKIKAAEFARDRATCPTWASVSACRWR